MTIVSCNLDSCEHNINEECAIKKIDLSITSIIGAGGLTLLICKDYNEPKKETEKDDAR